MPITPREVQMLNRIFSAARTQGPGAQGRLQAELTSLRAEGFQEAELDRPYGRIMERLRSEPQVRNPR